MNTSPFDKSRAYTIDEIVSLPDGHWNWLSGEIRRRRKSIRTGKPVRRLGSSTKFTAADKRWSADVKDQWHWTCAFCGKVYAKGSTSLEAAHIIPRAFRLTRCVRENGLPACRGTGLNGVRCHPWFDSLSLEEKRAAVIPIIGKETYDYLYALSRSGKGGA